MLNRAHRRNICILLTRSEKILVTGGGLLQCDRMTVRLVDHIEELLNRGVTLRREKHSTATAKKERAIVNQSVTVKPHPDCRFADILRHRRSYGCRHVGVVECETGGQFDRDVILFRPRVMKKESVFP